jgi:hypothetical protein
MYPSTKEFMDAEIAYRRERMIAARPSKRVWRRRGQRTVRSRALPQQRSHGVAAA